MTVRHPFAWLPESVQKHAFVGIFVFTLASMICMHIIGYPLVNETAPQGIVSFEFAGTFAIAQRMMASWGDKGLISAGILYIILGLILILIVKAKKPGWNAK